MAEQNRFLLIFEKTSQGNAMDEQHDPSEQLCLRLQALMGYAGGGRCDVQDVGISCS
jgi:hypothetical protein